MLCLSGRAINNFRMYRGSIVYFMTFFIHFPEFPGFQRKCHWNAFHSFGCNWWYINNCPATSDYLSPKLSQICNAIWFHLGWGLLKASIDFSVRKVFYLANVPVRFLQSLSYLAVVTAAELWRYLSNIKVIFSVWQWWKIGKITERGKLVT